MFIFDSIVLIVFVKYVIRNINQETRVISVTLKTNGTRPKMTQSLHVKALSRHKKVKLANFNKRYGFELNIKISNT